MTTTPDVVLKHAVTRGVEEIVRAYGRSRVRAVPDGQGGAWIEISRVPLGEPYDQGDTFLVCLLPFNLPTADVYPMFVRSDLTRTDGGAHGAGFGVTTLQWPGEATPRPVIQLSRRTAGDPSAQTPLQKIEKVLHWLRTR